MNKHSNEINFLDQEQEILASKFNKDGFVKLPVSDPMLFKDIQSFVSKTAAQLLKVEINDAAKFFNYIHYDLKVEELNQFRMAVIRKINEQSWFRPAYYRLAKAGLENLVGNELAMQLRINLSIQMPNDDSSLLAVHSDVWSGDSPFEIVAWIPLVDCFGTKTMYILPPSDNQSLNEDFKKFSRLSSGELFEAIADKVQWIDIKAGEILLFNQNLPHGNIVNVESETRWSMNCRFKSVFTPYGDKKIGEFFEPITLKPMSRIGMQYRYPKLNGEE